MAVIFIVTLQGFAETIYRDREQGIIPRPESSVAYVRANEARRSVTKSPEGWTISLSDFPLNTMGTPIF